MNMFAKASKVAAKPTAAAKKTKQEILIPGIQKLAEMHALQASLKAAMDTLAGEIKEQGFGEFLTMEGSIRPESFKGIDGQASCSVEMRKRGTNSALNEDEVAELEKLGLQPFTQVVTTEMYGINPLFAGDEELMNKVSKALEKIVPEGFIILQEGVSKKVVDDAMCDAAFKMPAGTPEREAAVRMCTTMALKPKLNADYDMKNLTAAVCAYLAPENEEVAEASNDALTAEAVALLPKAKAKKVAA